jgi:hypothetical protein
VNKKECQHQKEIDTYKAVVKIDKEGIMQMKIIML